MYVVSRFDLAQLMICMYACWELLMYIKNEIWSFLGRFPTRSDTNRTVQPKNIVPGLKFGRSIVLYVYSENELKGTDLLAASDDLRLCFALLLFMLFKKKVFFDSKDNISHHSTTKIINDNTPESGKAAVWRNYLLAHRRRRLAWAFVLSHLFARNRLKNK